MELNQSTSNPINNHDHMQHLFLHHIFIIRGMGIRSFIQSKPLGILLFLFSLILYGLTLSYNYSGGSIEFVTEIESGNLQQLFQPQKLLTFPIGWAFFQVWKLFGWEGSSLFPSQVLNALLGSISVFLIYLCSQQLHHSKKIAITTASCFMVSSGIWIFSTEAEFVTPAIAIMLMVFYIGLLFIKSSMTNSLHLLILGIFSGLSIVIYITNIFFIPAFIAILFIQFNKSWLALFRSVMIYLTGMMVIVVPVYTSVLVYIYEIDNFNKLSGFHLYGGQGIGTVYGKFEPLNVVYGFYALTRTIACFPSIGLDSSTQYFLANSSPLQLLLFILHSVFIAVILFLPIVAWVKSGILILPIHRKVSLFLVIWSAFNILFALYWVPKDMQFWLPVSIAWWIGFGYFVKKVDQIFTSRKVWKLPLYLPGIIIFLIFWGYLFVINGTGLAFPHHNINNNQEYWITKSVLDHTSPNDLIVLIDDERYIPYFTHRRTFSVINEILHEEKSKEEVYSQLRMCIEDEEKKGNKVYIYWDTSESHIRWDVLSKFGIEKKDFNQYSTRLAWSIGTTQFFEIINQ